MALPDTLRDLAHKCDVRNPILPPPALCPSLLAAADEIERLARKHALLIDEVRRLRPIADAARAMCAAL